MTTSKLPNLLLKIFYNVAINIEGYQMLISYSSKLIVLNIEY